MHFLETATLHTASGPQALRVKTARGFWSRFRGLMLAAPLHTAPCAQGLLIAHCPSVHGFFMRYALDVVYLASEPSAPMPPSGGTHYRVTHTAHLKPWRVSLGKPWQPPPVGSAPGVPLRSQHALELPAGSVAALGIAPGDRLEVQP
jgi:uncharacterized membrane protein (UPF0127 family)